MLAFRAKSALPGVKKGEWGEGRRWREGASERHAHVTEGGRASGLWATCWGPGLRGSDHLGEWGGL